MTKVEIRRQLDEALSFWRFKRPKGRGRPTNNSTKGRSMKMTPEAVVLIEHVIKNGGSLTSALATADVSKDAYYNWLAINPTFTDRIEQLKYHAETIAENTLVRGLKYDPELSLKYLERVKPDKYSVKGVQVNVGLAFDGIVLSKPKQVANLPDNHIPEISTEVTKPQLEAPSQGDSK